MPRDNTNAHSDLPELSNEDVAILYEIINVSSQSSDIQFLPFRAIFAAYDNVLAKHGISPAHDQLYLRFLFRLGERLGQAERGKEKDLFVEFEALLLELGIKIEVGSEQDSELGSDDLRVYAENTANIEITDTHLLADADTDDVSARSPRRARRASFSEILDITEGISRANRERPDSPASVSRLQDTSGGFGSRPFTRREHTRRRPSDTELDPPDLKREAHALNLQNAATKALPTKPSKDLQSSLAKTLAQRHQVQPARQNRRGTKVTDFEIYEDNPAEDGAGALGVHTSDHISARLAENAKFFDQFRIQRLSRLIWKQWCTLLLHRQRQRGQMLLLAIQYDRRELVKQAWNEWSEKYGERRQTKAAEERRLVQLRQAQEQNEYLAWREANAAKAREVYLVAKAFSHWANCTAERVQENAVARRHLVRLRYYNAWKEVTVVNDIKVQRMIWKKFLNTWQRKTQSNTALQHQARTWDESNLRKMTYWNWFWRFCEHRAPEWHDAKLKQRCLLIWANASGQLNVQKEQTHRSVSAGTQQVHLKAWTSRLNGIVAQERQADLFRKGKLLRKALSSWQSLYRLMEPARKVSAMVRRRIVLSTVNALCYGSNLYQQAKGIDLASTTRRAWTTWNDELRIRTMHHEIDDRLLIQALYRWVIAERGALMKRVHDERLLQQMLHLMLEKRSSLNIHLKKLEEQAQILRNSALTRAVLSIWDIKLQKHREKEKLAKSFRLPRVASHVIHQWHGAHEHQLQLTRWAIESAFYFRGRRSLQKWHIASKESQKQKRREAYAAVKRIYNRNLASAVFERWSKKSREMQEIHRREHGLQSRKREKLLLGIVGHWSKCLRDNDSRFSHACSHDDGKLASMTVQLWIRRSQLIIADMATSAGVHEARIQKVAYDSLRQLQLKLLTSQSHDAKASSVQNWNSRRRVRGLLRAWADRATSRRPAVTAEGDESHERSVVDSGPLLLQGMSLLSLARTPRTNRRSQLLPITIQSSLQQSSSPDLLVGSAIQVPTYPNTPSSRPGRTKPQGPSEINEQFSQRDQSYTPPTSRPQPRQSLRFAEDHTIIESPLRIPGPIQDLSQVEPPRTDTLPQRRQYIPLSRPNRSALSTSLTNVPGFAASPGLNPRIVDPGISASARSSTGVRRSLFPKTRRITRDDPGGDTAE